jgi:hypothetical protein
MILVDVQTGGIKRMCTFTDTHSSVRFRHFDGYIRRRIFFSFGKNVVSCVDGMFFPARGTKRRGRKEKIDPDDPAGANHKDKEETNKKKSKRRRLVN